MTQPKKHTAKGYRYLQFDSVGAFNAFTKHQMERLNPHNREVWKETVSGTQDKIDQGSDWYGSPPPKSLLELESHTQFLGMHLAERLEPKIRKSLERFLEHLGAYMLPKPKIAYNDRGLGIFCFERAAMGLYPAYPINLDTPIDTLISQLHIGLGQTRPRTHVRTVYAHFEDTTRNFPSLRLYLMAGGLAKVEGDEMLYVGLACAELVTFLETRGVAVEVNVLFGSSFNGVVNMSVVRVKQFQDALDRNQLLLLSSDPRYFRYNGFKGLVANANYFGRDIPYGLGKMPKNMATDFIKKGINDAFVFGQSYSLESAAKEVERILTEYQRSLIPKTQIYAQDHR